MKEPTWLPSKSVVAVHQILIAEHGGIAHIRDNNLLESALSRPRNLLAYGDEVSCHDLAAAYAFGLARNHPFVDGNKRIAFTAIAMFLEINGYSFEPEKMDALQTIRRLAAGDMEEEALARWIGKNSDKI
jgi:death-on-curing protein